MTTYPFYGGDVVRLVSGGPPMVVRWITKAEEEGYEGHFVVCCNWITEVGKCEEARFLEYQLESVVYDEI